jgi:carbonic anhydrase
MRYHDYDELIANNRKWSTDLQIKDPDFFKTHALGQSPPYLFVGCSDSRKSLNMITQTSMGELFIHRNVANQVSLTDMNFLSVLEYAVTVLKVKYVIICGHYGCGGVVAAYEGNASGIVEHWLMPVRDLYLEHQEEIDRLPTKSERIDRLCEMNVYRQTENVCRTAVMRNAFASGQYPQLHSWIFEMNSGLIKELPLPVEEWKQMGLLPQEWS